MYLKIKDLFEIKEFKNCKLISGEKGINNVITHVNAMEVPDISDWLSKGELLITTGYSIKDSPKELERLVVNLHKNKCAGLAIKTKFIKGFSKELLDISNDLGVPIIHIPDNIKYTDISTPIIKRIVDENNLRYELSEEIHDKFINIELNGIGIQGIADMVEGLLNNKVLILNKELEVLNKTKEEADYKYIYKYISDLKESKNTSIYELIRGEEKNYYIRKVYLKEKLVSYIVIIDIVKYNQLCDIVLDHASMALALEYSKLQSIHENTIALDSMFFVDLITNNIKSEKDATIRASSLDWPDLPYYMILFNINNFQSIKHNKTEYDLHLLKINLRDIVFNELKEVFDIVKVIIISDEFYALIPENYISVEKLDYSIQKTLNKVDERMEINLTAAISTRIELFEKMYDKAKEAQRALEVLKIKDMEKSHIYVRDTYIDQFILENKDNWVLDEFVTKNLKLLVEYDKMNNTDFYHTLEVYFKNDYNISKAASKLYIHRNTLTYRLEKIENILGKDFNSFEDKYNLITAMKINDIINLL